MDGRSHIEIASVIKLPEKKKHTITYLVNSVLLCYDRLCLVKGSVAGIVNVFFMVCITTLVSACTSR